MQCHRSGSSFLLKFPSVGRVAASLRASLSIAPSQQQSRSASAGDITGTTLLPNKHTRGRKRSSALPWTSEISHVPPRTRCLIPMLASSSAADAADSI